MEALHPAVVTDDRWRDLRRGFIVSDLNGYYDCPSITQFPDGRILLTVHRSSDREGSIADLQLFQTESIDGGSTWASLIPIEDAPGCESHDGFLLKGPSGRIYVFYGCNLHQLRGFPDGSPMTRCDMQLKDGYFFRTSTDQGRSWGKRLTIPVRRTAIDHKNPWRGEVMGMFLCDQPSIINGAVYMAFQKTADGHGETLPCEAFLLRSRGVLTDDYATWETLPRGEEGLHAPEGHVGEEPHVLQITGERLLVLWRTQFGKFGAAYSNDGGETFQKSFWLTYDGDRIMKNPRGSFVPRRLRDSSFAMVYYNNGGTFREGYCYRLVYWLTWGREVYGSIVWNEPEIVLYNTGPVYDKGEEGFDFESFGHVDGPGYPDLLEHVTGPDLSLVESNKFCLRFHRIDRRVLDHLRRQHIDTYLPNHFVRHMPPGAHRLPNLPEINAGGAFSFVISTEGNATPDGLLVDARSEVSAALNAGTARKEEDATHGMLLKGITIAKRDEMLRLVADNGFGKSLDVQCPVAAGNTTFVVDGEAGLAFAISGSGRLWDGGHKEEVGWRHIDGQLAALGGCDLQCSVPVIRYDRALLVSEAVAVSRWRSSSL